MMFDKFCIDKILAGEKCVTRRVARSNKRPAVPGTIHLLKKDRTKKNYGSIFINSCTKEPLLSITEEDAIREGFENKHEYLRYFKKINQLDNIDVNVWRVRFTYLSD